MKFREHFRYAKLCCVNENLDDNPHFAFFLQIYNFSFCHSYITHRDIFHQSFLRNYLIKDYDIFNNFIFSLKLLQPLMATAGGM